ncbi:MAG: hypothetical protein LC107_11870 [Chitinophagales bacterium]|nr:hypothetical protein [Chitinophagales bacterium]
MYRTYGTNLFLYLWFFDCSIKTRRVDAYCNNDDQAIVLSSAGTVHFILLLKLSCRAIDD